MDCRQAKSALADLSVEQLSPSEAQQLRDHCAQCPPCENERLLFQQTLLIMSTTSQPLLTPRQSHTIWRACARSLMEQIERERVQTTQPAFWRSPLGQWARSQPRWGWGALGGAVAVLGGVWLLSPQDGTQDAAFELSVPSRVSAEIVRFARPPAGASPFINHHAAMAFDPFTDHVGSTLVSSSATSAAPAAPASPTSSSSLRTADAVR